MSQDKIVDNIQEEFINKYQKMSPLKGEVKQDTILTINHSNILKQCTHILLSIVVY